MEYQHTHGLHAGSSNDDDDDDDYDGNKGRIITSEAVQCMQLTVVHV